MSKFKDMIERYKYDVRVKYYVIPTHRFNDDPSTELQFKYTTANMLDVPRAIVGAMKLFGKNVACSSS